MNLVCFGEAILCGSVFIKLRFSQVFAETDMTKLKDDAEFWSLMFMVMGFANGVSLLTSVSNLNCSEKN